MLLTESPHLATMMAEQPPSFSSSPDHISLPRGRPSHLTALPSSQSRDHLRPTATSGTDAKSDFLPGRLAELLLPPPPQNRAARDGVASQHSPSAPGVRPARTDNQKPVPKLKDHISSSLQHPQEHKERREAPGLFSDHQFSSSPSSTPLLLRATSSQYPPSFDSRSSTPAETHILRPFARRTFSNQVERHATIFSRSPLPTETGSQAETIIPFSGLESIPSTESSKTILVDVPSRADTDTPHPPGFMHYQDHSDATTRPRGARTIDDKTPTADDFAASRPAADKLSPQYVRTHDSIGKHSALSASSSDGGPYAQDFSHAPRVFSDYDINPSGTTSHGSGWSEGGDDRKVKRKRKPAPPELLVIVRPPPSKDRNPLNLQIQLVVPQAPQPVAPSTSHRVSSESSREGSAVGPRPGGDLKRRGSSSSARSGISVTTNASSASSTGGGRKVTPLYNLSFHTILPSTVSDAGTDQKVAKFSRKGVDVDGFGVLEPHELVRGVNDLSTMEALGSGPSMRPSSDIDAGSQSPMQESQDGSIPSPRPPGSDPGIEPPSDHAEPPTSFEAMTPEAKASEKSMGSRLMRRFKGLSVGSAKSLLDPSSTGGTAPSIAAGSTATTGAASGFSGLFGARSARTATVDSRVAASTTGPQTVALPAIRSSGSIGGSIPAHVSAGAAGSRGDVAPLVAGAGLADGSRKTRGYFWTIKKLTRRVADEEGNLPEIAFGPDGQNPVLRNVWRRFNALNRMGGNESHPHPAVIPVRFEWTKETRGSETRSSNGKSGQSAHRRAATDAARKRMSIASTGTGTTRSSFDDGRSTGRGGGSGIAAAAGLRRPSNGATSAREGINHNTARASSEVSGRGDATFGDSGNDGQNGYDQFEEEETDGNESDPEDSETPWSCHLVLGGDTRIPIGTLSPAPHHPKVVAQLAVPFPLPDLSQTGLGQDRAGLTREEIKDIICVTCLHLVIRESFGGLGSTRRERR